MKIRNCSGGVVFNQETVLLLKNTKGEWIFPKGVIREGEFPTEVAVNRVKIEANVDAQILCQAGYTNYEFFSITRQMPVANKISWYIMETSDNEVTPNRSQDFIDGGFFPIDEAIERVTYSQDKSFLRLAYQTYKEIR